MNQETTEKEARLQRAREFMKQRLDGMAVEDEVQVKIMAGDTLPALADFADSEVASAWEEAAQELGKLEYIVRAHVAERKAAGKAHSCLDNILEAIQRAALREAGRKKK